MDAAENQGPLSKGIASPVSTGGGGVEYEHLVGAYYLSALLLNSVPRGRDFGVTWEVRFQRLYEGEPLDDLIVVSGLPGGTAKLALQIKRSLSFGAKDQTFEDVIRSCWATFRASEFIIGTDRFGVILGAYSRVVDEHYQSVLSWARTSASAADFLARVSKERLSSQQQRNFVVLVRNKLNDVLGESVGDEDLWNFLRSMVILHFDFQRDGSRDEAYAVDTLGHALPSERRTEASNLFAHLARYAARANRTAGSFGVDTLMEKLLADGFSLLPAPDCRQDLERLREHADFVLGDIRTDIGGVELNRGPIIERAMERMREASFLEVTGPSGAGKSAVLKALVEARRGEGPVMMLAGNRITGTGWNGFAHDLRLDRRLEELLLALSGAASPCLFIDGVDRVLEPGPRMAVSDLLRGLAEVSRERDGSARWTVVVTIREENLQEVHSWLDWRIFEKSESLRVPELSSEEVEVVGRDVPRLRPLLSTKHLEPITRNPFMLSLLEDRRVISNPQAPLRVATEIEVATVWWERIVDSGGHLGRGRQQALLRLGEDALRSPGCCLIGNDVPADVLKSLELDRILLRDEGRDVYRFGHDLLEDWVECRVLNQRREYLVERLADLDQPFGLFRAVQLVGASLLEQSDTAEEWARLLKEVEKASNLAPRWRQALLTAPLVSASARTLLDKAEPFLMEDDAWRLTDLMVALRTVEVNPNLSLLPAAERFEKTHDELLTFLLTFPVPRWREWLPLVGWLVDHARDLPAAVRPEAARIMEIWQRNAPDNSVYRREVGEIAFTWLKEGEEEK